MNFHKNLDQTFHFLWVLFEEWELPYSRFLKQCANFKENTFLSYRLMQKWIQQQLPWKKSMKRYYSFSSQSIKSVMIVILLFQKYFIQYTWILNGIRQQAQPFLAFSLHEGQNEY